MSHKPEHYTRKRIGDLDHRPTSLGAAIILVVAGAVIMGTIIVLALPVPADYSDCVPRSEIKKLEDF